MVSLEFFIGIIYGRRFAPATELENSSKEKSVMDGGVGGGHGSKRAEALEEEEEEEEEEGGEEKEKEGGGEIKIGGGRDEVYRGADKSLARPTSRCFLFDVRIFRLMLVLIYINSTNIPPIVIINRIYEHENLLSL